MNTDGFHEECGVFGIYNHPEAANLTYLGLHGLQHRGQESAGIAVLDGEYMFAHREMGLVGEIFTEKVLRRLPGKHAIGHVRYSTAGSSSLKNSQPFTVEYYHGSLAIAHNGNLVNSHQLRDKLESIGAIFQSTMDTEVIVHLISRSDKDELEDRLIDALNQVKGAYSLVVLGERRLIAVRDPHGYRPLVLGEKDGAPIVCSETCALDLIEAKFVREILPGEMLVIDRTGIHSFFPFPKHQLQQCVFEFVYFARPDSTIFSRNVYLVRKQFGVTLAIEHPVEADIVMGVPDSGIPSAIGYSKQSGIPYVMGMIRSHYMGRTFIEPSQNIRHFGVKLKLNPVREVLDGKRVVVIDDSIVRGTTSKKIVSMIRNAGAKEVHLRISSPPTSWSCYYGVDTPTRDELIAGRLTVEEIAEFIGVDSLGYLTVEGMKNSLCCDPDNFCYACFDGDYHVPYQPPEFIRQLTLFENPDEKALKVIK